MPGLPLEEWECWQEDFQIEEKIGAVYVEEWRHAPPSWRRARLRESCDFARDAGLFVGGTPTFKIARFHAQAKQ